METAVIVGEEAWPDAVDVGLAKGLSLLLWSRLLLALAGVLDRNSSVRREAKATGEEDAVAEVLVGLMVVAEGGGVADEAPKRACNPAVRPLRARDGCGALSAGESDDGESAVDCVADNEDAAKQDKGATAGCDCATTGKGRGGVAADACNGSLVFKLLVVISTKCCGRTAMGASRCASGSEGDAGEAGIHEDGTSKEAAEEQTGAV
jgi:hypothetical protein